VVRVKNPRPERRPGRHAARHAHGTFRRSDYEEKGKFDLSWLGESIHHSF
jgi:hypothetical protein